MINAISHFCHSEEIAEERGCGNGNFRMLFGRDCRFEGHLRETQLVTTLEFGALLAVVPLLDVSFNALAGPYPSA